MVTIKVFMDIFALKEQGFSIRSIAAEPGVFRNVATRHLERAHPPKHSKNKRR